MKISNRLATIAEIIPRDSYDHIWDCCCDHGLLGMRLLKQKTASHVHFVDIVPSIMANLTNNLQRFFGDKASSSPWSVYCQDVSEIDLAAAVGSKQLVIIAGVGGEQTIAMVEQLVNKFPQQQLDFLLCPVRHQYKLRAALFRLKLGLLNEILIEENQRFYEIIHVSTNSSIAISAIGSRIWHQFSQRESLYLNQTIAHFERDAQSGSPVSLAGLKAYQQLKLNL